MGLYHMQPDFAADLMKHRTDFRLFRRSDFCTVNLGTPFTGV